MTTGFNIMQQIKRRFFAMRNGIIADTLRRAGSPFKIIFGLNLPQLIDIANEFGPDKALSETMWANNTTRESMLLAPMLMPHDEITETEASKWIEESPSTEIIDNLCHHLLRHTTFSFELADKLCRSDSDKAHYAAMRLLWHHIYTHQKETKNLAQTEISRNCPLTHQAALQIVEEIEFINA